MCVKCGSNSSAACTTHLMEKGLNKNSSVKSIMGKVDLIDTCAYYC